MTQAAGPETGTMHWTSALSGRASLEDALTECAALARRELPGRPDLAVVFATPHYAKDFAAASRMVDKALQPVHILGCSAGGVIGSGREAEGARAVSVLAACLPGVSILPFHLEGHQVPDSDAPPRAWGEAVGLADRGARPHFALLADPFTFNPEDLTRGLDFAFPESVKVGGIASGAGRPGGNALWLDGACHRSGAVGLAFTGNVVIDPVVAQGCRPIGPAFSVTACEDNVLQQLAGRPCLEVLEELLDSLPPADQQLARTSLFLGVLAAPLKQGTEARDYLIRNLTALDTEKGVLAIGALLRHGMTVRFHLRDKKTSAEDLRLRLGRYAAGKPAPAPQGALLFSCMGRGAGLYGAPDHDSKVFHQLVGPVPLGGFFCNGEIGPVEGSTYLHGYTSCFGIFRPAA